ncbi:MAG: hypothetical protein ACI9HY_000860 [Planctomycetaceae bacterium]|jgi:hypothetical protein
MKPEKLNGMSTAPPGRFSDPKMTLATDPRTDPRVVEALIAYGSGGDMSAMPLVGTLPVWMFEWLMAAIEPMKEKNWPADLLEI